MVIMWLCLGCAFLCFGSAFLNKEVLHNFIEKHQPNICQIVASKNWTYSSLDYLGGRKGLTEEFIYRTVCLHILSGILYKATNMKTVEYANEYLFKPLGFKIHTNYYVETAEEYKAFTI